MVTANDTEEKWVLMTELNGEPLIHHFKLSNFGNVVRIKRGVGEEEPFFPKNIGGYKYISFTTQEGSRETIYVHRLVAEFFVDNDNPDADFVIHKDYNRQNNRFDNLTWVTRKTLYKHRSKKAGRIPIKIKADEKISFRKVQVNEEDAFKDAEVKRLLSEYTGVI